MANSKGLKKNTSKSMNGTVRIISNKFPLLKNIFKKISQPGPNVRNAAGNVALIQVLVWNKDI